MKAPCVRRAGRLLSVSASRRAALNGWLLQLGAVPQPCIRDFCTVVGDCDAVCSCCSLHCLTAHGEHPGKGGPPSVSLRPSGLSLRLLHLEKIHCGKHGKSSMRTAACLCLLQLSKWLPIRCLKLISSLCNLPSGAQPRRQPES